MNTTKGILIIAQGKKRYIDMAKQISISLSLSNPSISKALVTDSTDDELKKYYDLIIPIDEQLGKGYSQKLYMYQYSPFEKTLFIDVDCLVIDSIDWLFERFNTHPVSVIGKILSTGALLGTTVEELKKKIDIQYLPTFNGGVYYFEKGTVAQKVFADAIHIFNNRYEELNLWKFSGQAGDEPAMSIAMAMNQMQPIDDDARGMYTPVGQTGVFKMDALKGFCEFYKYDKKVTPVIMHFGGGYPEAFHYKRETTKLKWVYQYRMPRMLTSVMVNALYNPPYIVFVFLYRIIKKIIKGGNLKFTPLMPMFRFE
jgi:hypothetical protein